MADEIDLYGDVDQEFSQEDFGDDIDDGKLNRNGNSMDMEPEIDQNGIPTKNLINSLSTNVNYEDRGQYPGSGPSNKYQLFVGNLNWWSTDEDVMEAVKSLGISDIIEIKFHENRANGQSKGFCTLALETRASGRIVMDKLGQKEIRGMNPIVTYFTKQALQQFESKSKTRSSPQQHQQQQQMGNSQGGPRNLPPRMPPHSNMEHRPVSHQPQFRPPLGPPMNPHGPQPPPGGMPPHAIALNNNPRYHMPRPMPPPPINNPMRGPPPAIASTINVPPPRPPPPIDGRHLALQPNYLQMPPVMHGPVPQVTSGMPPAPHVNPAFFPPHSVPPPNPTTSVIPKDYPPPAHGYNSGLYADHRIDAPPPISEAEFEDIMNRNRTVSSSAIARAVADASSGEYAGAMETLVTATSLIRQSKVAHDERCKILISSLQDTLHGIEAKSYGSKRRERSRTPTRRHRRERSRSRGYRSRSHSREREYERQREKREDRRERDYERSYSSDKDYDKERELDRERERERERYYEERYRERRERIEERLPRERVEERLPRDRMEERLPRDRIEERLPRDRIEERLPRERIEERLPRERIEERLPRERIEERLPRERSSRDDNRDRERERDVRNRSETESSSQRSRHN